MRPSLRLKVALALFAATVVLLLAQAVAVRTLAEAQEERLIGAVIADDMRNLLQSYRVDPASLPPFDAQLRARVSQDRGAHLALPAMLATLAPGVHEVILGGHEVHVAVTALDGQRLYRVYDYGAYERHFKDGLNILIGGTALFVLPSVWLAYSLSGLLVRQVAGLARQVRALRAGTASAIEAGDFDEREVAELGEAVNDYHRRMAAMVAREKEFAGNVSHELRTPLTAIRTSCELLEPAVATLDDKSRRRFRQIEQAAADMHGLIDCLLTLARDESRQQFTLVSLAALVDATCERFAERMARQAIHCVMTVPAEVRVAVNPSALGIVLSNLVDNALRHTERGAIRFGWDGARLCIDDTGSGIAPDALPHLFERHYRAPDARADGFGIGLAIVKRICERYGWHIGIESGPGGGTRVMLGLA